MRIYNILPYVAALLLGVTSSAHAADSAKVKEAIKYSQGICVALTDDLKNLSCRKEVVVRDEKHPESLLEITAGTDLIGGKASLILKRVQYNPTTENYFIVEFSDGDSKKGVDANGILEKDGIDKVLVAASKNKDGPHRVFEVDLGSQSAQEIHQDMFDESIDQFIKAAKGTRW
ncbi:hypothetical protein HY637_04540 [Candidatus Woesearchaeota archaeon]|nr:hypothetical protein [Candidatus Woesearchaeota archaeon]